MFHCILENVLQNKMLVSELAQTFRAIDDLADDVTTTWRLRFVERGSTTAVNDDVDPNNIDVLRMYWQFAKRLLPWSQVNQNKLFLHHWWKTDEHTRRFALSSLPHFEDQLHDVYWCGNMLQRDDVLMLVSLPAMLMEEVVETLDVLAEQLEKQDRLAQEEEEENASSNRAFAVSPKCFRALRRSPILALARMNAAARKGDLARMKVLRRRAGFYWNATTCAAAAEGGHLACLEFARSKGCPWDAWTCVLAAANGHLECLRFALQGRCPVHRKTSVLRDGDKEMQFTTWGRWVDVASGAHLQSLERAVEIGYQWPGMVCHWAAVRGHFDCLVAARDHGCWWSGDDQESAAKSIEF